MRQAWRRVLTAFGPPTKLGGLTPPRFRGRDSGAMTMKDACEKCRAALAPDGEAYVCSYECTFCARCAGAMASVCPNCGGELLRRPRRRATGAVAPVIDPALIQEKHRGHFPDVL